MYELYEKTLWRPHQGCLLTSTYCTCYVMILSWAVTIVGVAWPKWTNSATVFILLRHVSSLHTRKPPFCCVENTLLPCMVCLLQQYLYQITLDTMLKHPQITDLELCFQNKSPLNNLDNRITFLYQYAWRCVCQQYFCLLRAVTCR